MKVTRPGLRVGDLEFPLEVGSPLPTGAAQEAVTVLGRRITNGVYAPGETMPTEPELAASLNVSRATVRDAIKVLSGKGLVRTARRYGTRVRPLEEWSLLDADVVSWHDPEHPRIHQMFAETTELRCIIEPAAAALAAERASDDQIARILQSAHAMHPGEADVQAMFNADCIFHATVLEATGNMMMRQMQKIILTILRISYEYGVLVVDGEPVSREGHIHVAEAIRDRNPAKAERTMRDMLQINRRTATDFWQRNTLTTDMSS
ncbi:transcriptional regulator, GntR family [Pseudooceanicola antarcticus]|uniref:FadR family transcriptional regulator n=1 Tax=Pseudooceanicola antarcticus TaxID=1247613 RepID=A0A285IJA4_9RHOB|nr:FCD domain-containing protein [Pseudooceanicola antarcticus]PJE28839.1 FadR family transcriptional regulator [Pseudooceanicola antarcticus]SNY48052.1 transcriptional regulator, GntR family [Pseudooceanicola antarcticus]